MANNNIIDPNKPIKYQLDKLEENVMSELKDFQKATVERIDELYRNKQNRVLVSDEVGLGKTLIARGTITKFARLRKEVENDDLVKVVYICSNSAVAGQNLEKLKVINEVTVDNSDSSRLSMQHLNIFNQEYDENILNNYIQLISLTPQTSFKISNREGTVKERALMFAVLKRILSDDVLEELEKIFIVYAKQSWGYYKDTFEEEFINCNKKSGGDYEKYMINELNKSLNEVYVGNNEKYNGKLFIDYINEYCLSNEKTNRESKSLIVELRNIFADISLNKLDADLIIMDEFQRFKYLINEDNSEISKLTNKFFNKKDCRILMLSATPYKMYSTLDELDGNINSHYKEFLDVIKFLNIEEDKNREFKEIWNNYSIQLKEIHQDNLTVLSAKTDAENALYNTICRTERFSENKIEDLINLDINKDIKVLKEDIKSYLEIQKVIEDIEPNLTVPIDYIKSSPYLMSFMNNYKLKTKITSYFKKHPEEISKMNKKTFWLNKNRINKYKPIKNNNARLDYLMNYVLKDNSEKLLWIPPSKPYYPLEGVFKKSENISKTLIFSSWEMVPRMISSLVSYEVERRTVGKLKKNKSNLKYFSKNRYPSHRMTFSSKDGTPTQMYLFTNIYASEFLSNCYNPIDCLNRNLTLKEIEKEVKLKIKEKLNKLEDKIETDETSNREDLRWYYLTPLLLDSLEDKEIVDEWFENLDDYINNELKDYKGFKLHIDELKLQFDNIYYKEDKLGKKPKDLINILCDVAIASPAICIYRSYKKESFIEDYKLKKLENYKLRKHSVRAARAFINRMNSYTSIAVIDLTYGLKNKNPYWKKLLKYCKQGNLQGVLDEYTHLLSNGLDKHNENRILLIHNKFLNSFEVNTSNYEFDTYNTFSKRIKEDDRDKNSLRTHFAVSFTKGKEESGNRQKTVRDAFNSPFRPFVLASTSIGQEGLDFHNYCRRIVHWNLPSNPIDLEQREGRINRFECLAIRQNIAKRYGDIIFKKNIWNEMFNEASIKENDDECSDLIPYWGLKESEDMIKIERIVPTYPFSLDKEKYKRLIKILSLYRLTLGQARQEELIEYLFDNDIEDKISIDELGINLSPFYKNKSYHND